MTKTPLLVSAIHKVSTPTDFEGLLQCLLISVCEQC
jgi:hypothetical protein